MRREIFLKQNINLSVSAPPRKYYISIIKYKANSNAMPEAIFDALGGGQNKCMIEPWRPIIGNIASTRPAVTTFYQKRENNISKLRLRRGKTEYA